MNLVLQYERRDRRISIRTIYLLMFKDANVAVFLSQLLYWSTRGSLDGGWIYKKADEWEAETGLTRKKQERARRILKDANVLEEVLTGVPPVLHFRVNEVALDNLEYEFVSSLEGEINFYQRGKLNSTDGGNRIPPKGENNTYSTSDSTKEDIAVGEPTADHTETRSRKKSDLDRIKDELFLTFVRNARLVEELLPAEGAPRNKLFYTPLLKLYTYYRPKNTMPDGSKSKKVYNYDNDAMDKCTAVIKEAVARHTAPSKKHPNGLTIKSVESVTYLFGEILREEKGGTRDAKKQIRAAIVRYGRNGWNLASANMDDGTKEIVRKMGNWASICEMNDDRFNISFARAINQ